MNPNCEIVADEDWNKKVHDMMYGFQHSHVQI